MHNMSALCFLPSLLIAARLTPPNSSYIVGYYIHDDMYLFPSPSASFLSLFSISPILLMIFAWSELLFTPNIFANSHWDDASSLVFSEVPLEFAALSVLFSLGCFPLPADVESVSEVGDLPWGSW